MIRGCDRRELPWIGLLAICLLFVTAVAHTHPTNLFGFTEDDSIYFSSAKALADNRGYVLASFPGTPSATKYPVFYPWLLSLVWRWNQSFPANLTDAIAVTVLFGLWYLTSSFIFLRRVVGFRDLESLVITAFCALHPLFIFYSSQVLSDIPFAALAITAIVLAETSNRDRTGDIRIVTSGVLSGLAILMRILGVPVSVGIALALALRRSWKQFTVFCGSVAPFFATIAWRLIFPHESVSPASGPAASTLPWLQTWAYYTNYVNDWKLRIPDKWALVAALKANALGLLRAPADYFLRPWPASHTFFGQVIGVMFTLVIVRGILRLRVGFRASCYSSVLGLYTFVLLFWVYLNHQRFLILFLPLFCAGLVVETTYLAKSLNQSLSQVKLKTRRLGTVALSGLIVFFGFVILIDFYDGMRKEVRDLSKNRAFLLAEKRQAYHWLAASTDENTRVLANDDGVLYLYTGRQAVRPSPPAAGREYGSTMGRVPPLWAGVAQAIDADYWLISDDDPDLARPVATGDLAEADRLQPVVFRSNAGHVRIYSLRCMRHPKNPECLSASAVSFPQERSRGRQW